MTVAVDSRPRRLLLAAAELGIIYDLLGAQLPEDFEVAAEAHDHSEARDLLAQRGIVDAEGALNPAVAANVSILVNPELLVKASVRGPAVDLHAIHAARGVLGASLIRVVNRGAELSIFPAPDLGRELRRVVPDMPTRRGAVAERLEARPNGLEHKDWPAVGFTLDAPTYGDLVAKFLWPAGGRTLEDSMSSAEERVAGRWLSRVSCVLRAWVIRPGAAPRVGGLIWYGTSAGWFGVRPELGDEGQKVVRILPVSADDYVPWLAPFIEEALP